MLDNEKDSEDATDLVRMIKSDLVPEEVFVFTPRGDVISLPSGSTVIDFAYAIHSAVGNRMIGAKVDKRIVPLDYRVKTGEIVEVLTSKEAHGPSRDWLKIVKTSEARNKIRTWFKHEKRDENIVEGRAEMERELRRNGIDADEEELNAILLEACSAQQLHDGGRRLCCHRLRRHLHVENPAEGQRRVAERTCIARWRRFFRSRRKRKQIPQRVPPELWLTAWTTASSNFPAAAIRCRATISSALSRAGSVFPSTSGAVPTCRSVISEAAEPERWVKVHWAGEISEEEFKTTLEIVAEDRSGLLADITQQLFSMHLFIHSLNSRETKDGTAFISATISISNIDQLKSIMSRLSNIAGVISIRRT